MGLLFAEHADATMHRHARAMRRCFALLLLLWFVQPAAAASVLKISLGPPFSLPAANVSVTSMPRRTLPFGLAPNLSVFRQKTTHLPEDLCAAARAQNLTLANCPDH